MSGCSRRTRPTTRSPATSPACWARSSPSSARSDSEVGAERLLRRPEGRAFRPREAEDTPPRGPTRHGWVRAVFSGSPRFEPAQGSDLAVGLLKVLGVVDAAPVSVDRVGAEAALRREAGEGRGLVVAQ